LLILLGNPFDIARPGDRTNSSWSAWRGLKASLALVSSRTVTAIPRHLTGDGHFRQLRLVKYPSRQIRMTARTKRLSRRKKRATPSQMYAMEARHPGSGTSGHAGATMLLGTVKVASVVNSAVHSAYSYISIECTTITHTRERQSSRLVY
jgi:hypothetical protein